MCRRGAGKMMARRGRDDVSIYRRSAGRDDLWIMVVTHLKSEPHWLSAGAAYRGRASWLAFGLVDERYDMGA
jgi:hypothetical protein